jgi:hypothetical protein
MLTTDDMPPSEDHDENIDDLLNDLDMTPIEETDEEVFAALNSELRGVAFDAPTIPRVTPNWLTDVQKYAAKHGPFSTAQIVKIIQALNAVPNSRGDSDL